jgi:antitoxin MazE
MRTLVSKWGNSLGVRIPKAAADAAGLSAGASVEVKVARGSVVIALARHEYSLEELTAAITRQNRHGEADWGSPAGNESW